MVLFKQEKGKRVQLSDEEEAQVRAEWARNDKISAKELELGS